MKATDAKWLNVKGKLLTLPDSMQAMSTQLVGFIEHERWNNPKLFESMVELLDLTFKNSHTEEQMANYFSGMLFIGRVVINNIPE